MMDEKDQSKATAKESAVADGKTDRPQASARSWYSWYLALAILVLLSVGYFAVRWVGYLCGWIIGASLSPIASVALPLVFTLLGAVGVSAGIRTRRLHLSNLICLIGIALGVWVFCDFCERGIDDGGRTRQSQYKSITQLLGCDWQKLDADVKSKLYQFRREADEAGLSFREYESFMTEVIKPIAASTDADKSAKIIREIESAEAPLIDVSPSQRPTKSSSPSKFETKRGSEPSDEPPMKMSGNGGA
jgi:hypothetical protein